MQYRPTQEELLLAVADFIDRDVRPELADRALAFRCLIAANLTRMAVLERRMEEWHDGIELDGMRALLDGLPSAPPPTKDARRDLLQELNDQLARAIREGDLELSDVEGHLRIVLKGRLAVTNPRFDAELGWPAEEEA